MNRDKWQKAKEIFEGAIERAPDQRGQLLDETCEGDEELRAEVEALLSSFDGAGSFLNKPAAGYVAELIMGGNGKIEKGQMISHYEIISQIGAGGMGEVYLAQDTQLGRRVALKLLPPDFAADDNRARRFKQEARAASALNHPNILVIHEVGETQDKRLFIATEYIEGETLRARLNDKGLNLAETLEIAVQVAGALAAAHEAGIVHRDVKPENIMLRPDGYVKVLDFGLAKFVENQFQLNPESPTLAQQETASGMILGTVRYMSPEQARGQKIDARSDVFSFGTVLYEMIAGRTPFAGDSNVDSLAAIINQEPPPLTQFSADVPVELEQIVVKTLKKDREERYQTVKDILADLKDLQDELRVQAKLHKSSEDKTLIQPTQLNKAATTNDQKAESVDAIPTITASNLDSSGAKNKRRRFAMTGALVLILGILSASAIWFFLLRQKSFTPISVQNITQLTTSAGLDDYPSISPDGKSVAYTSDQNGSFEIFIKSLTPGAKAVQLTNDNQQNFQPAFSPDGGRVAYYSKLRGGVWVIPAGGGEPKQLTDFGSHPAWSPDGKQIVFQSNGITDLGAYARNALPPSTLWIVASDGGGEARQLTKIGEPPGGHGSPAFSPDGKRIAFEANTFFTSSVWNVSINGDDPKLVSPQSNSPLTGYAPVYAPDGQSIFYHGGEVFQARINPETGETIGEPMMVSGIVQPPTSVRRIGFSADGKKIAYSVLRRSESISSVPLKPGTGEAAGPAVALVTNNTLRNMYPVFSPDGKRLAFTSCPMGGSGCDLWLTNPDGGGLTQLTTAESNEVLPSWFPDGEQMSFLSNRSGYRALWAINLNTKRERLLLDLKKDLDYAKLSPDGKKVLLNITTDGVINTWMARLDGGGGGGLEQLTFDKELMGFPAWSPDGKFIAFQVKRGDDTHAMIMPSGGGAPEQLTFAKGQSWIFGWSPDGDKVLFAGHRDGYWNVWWVSRSTKKERQLTDHKKLNSFVRYPSWSPRDDQIAYEYSETTGNIWVADLK